MVALWESVLRFDESKGAKFSTFAYGNIHLKLLSARKEAIYSYQASSSAIYRATHVFTAEMSLYDELLGRKPTLEEVNSKLTTTEKGKQRVTQGTLDYYRDIMTTTMVSADSVIYENEGVSTTVGDTLTKYDDSYNEVEVSMCYDSLSEHLSDTEKKVLTMKLLGYSSSAIADDLGIARSTVSGCLFSIKKKCMRIRRRIL